MLGQFLLLIRQCAGDHCALFVQPVEGCTEFAPLRLIHGEPILFQPLTFSLCLCRAGILTADVHQFCVTQPRILFNGTQGIRRLDCFVLMRVTGENAPALDIARLDRDVSRPCL